MSLNKAKLQTSMALLPRARNIQQYFVGNCTVYSFLIFYMVSKITLKSVNLSEGSQLGQYMSNMVLIFQKGKHLIKSLVHIA